MPNFDRTRRNRITAVAPALLALALAALAQMAAVPPARAQAGRPAVRPLVDDALTGLEAAVGSPVRATVSAKTGLVTFLSFAPYQQNLGRLPAEAPAEDRARAFLDGYGAAFGVAGRESLALARIDERDEVGMEHVRFRQMHQGIPVTGGEMTVHLRGSNVVAVNAKTVPDLDAVAVTPLVTPEEVSVLAADVLARELGVTDAELSAPRLELLNRRHLGGRGFATTLAWFVEARKIDLREFLWIDAIGGRELLRFSQLTDAKSRTVHDTAGSGTLPGPVARSEGQAATGDTDVDAAYDYSGDTYDYFFSEHGRDSYDGAGAPLISTVDYCPGGSCPYNNAFWNGTQMVYGAGFPVADDVDAHELTHAVTEHTANLYYYMQSGALNESYSDIFGETVDLTNTGGTDTPATRWQMGEDVPGFGAIRDMMDPTIHGDPGKTSDPQFVCENTGNFFASNNDAGGVHSNSGVPNHAYALMVDGDTYNLITVTGIGLTKAGKVQYRALANYLLSASDFLDNYNALNQACADLVGTAGITTADCAEVKDALDAVEMSSTWPCAPTQSAVPALCTAPAAPELFYSEDFEAFVHASVPACSTTGVFFSFCLNQPGSVLGPFATSGVKSAWAWDPYNSQDFNFAVTVPGSLPANALMQFNHSFGFDDDMSGNYDGGLIEYSTTGAPPFSDLGPMIIDGQAYGGALSAFSPLAGSQAFVKDTWGFTASQVDLSSLSGSSFTYRFRVVSDGIVDDRGWFIDDVRIYTCATCPTTRAMDGAYSGTADLFKASTSITAGDGFTVGVGEDVTLESPSVIIMDDFVVIGNLTIGNISCM